ncbi:jun dimerization protein 2-like [Asterias rubens]|uniref:jun dimerization protein 2-like n=1 Tax=Asterias rubens TaxID=7604 RepID=UPI001455B484|nr:jun dimerization protein 2-like [Asterias rubens]
MERIVMPGDELWDPAGGFDLTANGLTTLNNGFDPVSPPPQQNNTETDAEFMHRTMLREELRVNILQRRLQKGLGAVQLDWRFTKPENLTPEEEDRRKLRRERNRVAASRCREKRRERTYVLVKETDQLETSNQELIREIQQLETERQELVAILSSHQQTCGCSPPVPNPSLDDLHIDP